MGLKVDQARDITRVAEPDLLATGIHVRALRDGRWDSVDIFELTRDSLHEWVRSRGPVSDWAMGLIEHLLLHVRDGGSLCGAVNPRTGMVCDIPPHESKKHWTQGADGQRYDWFMEAS